MRRCLRLLSYSAALGALAMVAAPAAHAAGAGACAKSLTETIGPGGPLGGSSCWIEYGQPGEPKPGEPYPFGTEGEAVQTSKCPAGVRHAERQVIEKCYLMVTSMAFRAWNRGLAATGYPIGEVQGNPYGVWIFNGTDWYPAPGFPGSTACPGHTIVWAGKLDYWLVGDTPSSEKWGNICRFDGEHLEWEPLEIPAATLAHATRHVIVEGGEKEVLQRGAITSAACFAWNNCWFFGSYGTVMRWDGEALTDQSPDPSERWLQGDYTGAVARRSPSGEPFGVAVSRTSKETGGLTPAQLYGSGGGAFSPLPFTPFTDPRDPYGTDLVAVDLDSMGQGWVAGNPAAGETPPQPSTPAVSPLQPVSPAGEASACKGPPATDFRDTLKAGRTDPQDLELSEGLEWSSVAVIPATGEALVGGRIRQGGAGPNPGPNDDAEGEPVIARANCGETTTRTRFRIEDPNNPGKEAPADRGGGPTGGRVTAITTNAANGAWAATTPGELAGGLATEYEPPHLYRLGPLEGPEEKELDEEKQRPKEEEEKEKKAPEEQFTEEPPPPPVVQPPATVTQTHTVTLPAAVYDVKAKLHSRTVHGHVYLSLYLTFKIRRPVTIGAQALRHGRVVSVARARHFAGHTGLLILTLDRKHWPTNVRFVA